MLVEASALVAILANEPERSSFLKKLVHTDSKTTPVAVFEATLALARIKGLALAVAEQQVWELLESMQVMVLHIEKSDTHFALDAHARFGKGRGHPAQLNMGDCLIYAVAMRRNMPLLFKGNDFIETDIARA